MILWIIIDCIVLQFQFLKLLKLQWLRKTIFFVRIFYFSYFHTGLSRLSLTLKAVWYAKIQKKTVFCRLSFTSIKKSYWSKEKQLDIEELRYYDTLLCIYRAYSRAKDFDFNQLGSFLFCHTTILN